MPLRGAGGEAVSFARTIRSHGCASLPPAKYDAVNFRDYDTVLRVADRAVSIRLSAEGNTLHIDVSERLTARQWNIVTAIVRRMFRLDDDLSPFYAMVQGDATLGWAARTGAGRLLASPTLFEDVVKTLCTTNCAWSATIRMTSALVGHAGGTFPTPQELAATPDSWYRDVARMGYRGPYVRAIAGAVAGGNLDLESLRAGAAKSAAEVEAALLDLPGIGPYAAAHIMQLAGYHGLLILDSWTRPTYLRLSGKRRATDDTIRRAFAKYGRYAGLAFWLYLTREWVSVERNQPGT